MHASHHLSCSPTFALAPLFFVAQGGQLTPITLTVEEEYHRAAPGGTGGTK